MKAGLWLSLSMAALAMPGIATAQTAPNTTTPAMPAANSTSDQPAEEIVVTAERRSTNLQTTAVAASVLTSADLQNRAVNNVDQLQFVTPSLTVNNAGQGNFFNIRGIGKTDGGSATGVGVITYRDGVATLPGFFQTEPYYDIASVEVLRGPQGTFAGGNATGGAVFITEASPNFDGVNGFVMGQAGNYNDYKIQGAVNLPVSDTLALRLATNDETRDSFYHITGPFTGDPGHLRSYGVRGSLLWQATPDFRVLLKLDYNNIDLGGYPGDPATATNDPFHITNNAHNSARDSIGRAVLNLEYRLESGITLRSISGFQYGTTSESIDVDGADNPLPFANFTARDHAHERIWSQEFNLVSPDTGRLNWVLGAYYQKDDTIFPVGDFVTGAPQGVFDLSLDGINPKTATAFFGQVGYKLTDSLQLQVGARWSRTTSANDANFTILELPALPVGFPLFPLGNPITQNVSTADSGVTGKVALNWEVDPNNFLYAFVATGAKAGGVNAPNLGGAQVHPFSPEHVTDYELGWKANWFGGHLRTQLGAYYNQYKDFQISVIDPVTPTISQILNVPDTTELYGIEASAQARFEALSFDFAASVSDSKLGTFFAARNPSATPCNPTTGPAIGSCVELSGTRQTYDPRITISAGVQYQFQLGSEITLTPRVDYAHIGEAWATLFENEALGDRLGERNIVNAQLTLAQGPWALSAYGTNLNDDVYVAAINGTRRIVGPPRQYGIRVTRSF